MEEKAKILVVDDEEGNLILTQDILMHQGYEVVLAHDGEEALEKVEDTPPDVILLDLKMPKISGFEVMEKLKRDE